MNHQDDGNRFTTAEVAQRIGVHRATLLRWLREGLVPEPTRDGRGWRVFGPADLENLERFARLRSEGGSYPLDDLDGEDPPEIRKLREVEWDFENAKTSYLTHGFHPYPAKFIPQIPNALIQELSSVGDRVADIFCGSGTTLVEALLLKRHAVGVDANPLAALISRAKTTRLADGDIETLHHLSQRSKHMGDSIAMQDQGLMFDFGTFKSKAPRPKDDKLAFWFLPFVIEELAEIKAWCDAIESESARTIALSAFSSIIVTVSRQDSDTRYTRRDKGTRPGEAFQRFARAVADSLQGAVEFADLVEPRFSSTVIHADLLEGPAMGPVDLVVSSPPYPNAYSYHLYHRSRMQWLNMDQADFKRREIGSHRKYSRRGSTAATPETFLEEMRCIFAWLSGWLKPGGYAAFVIGDSTINGEVVDNASLLREAAREGGMVEVACLDRSLQSSKKSFNPAIGKIKTERIVILRKAGT